MPPILDLVQNILSSRNLSGSKMAVWVMNAPTSNIINICVDIYHMIKIHPLWGYIYGIFIIAVTVYVLDVEGENSRVIGD